MGIYSAGINYGCHFERDESPESLKSITDTIASLNSDMLELEASVAAIDANYYKNELALLHNRSQLIETRNPFQWKPFDKAYVSLIFDDGRHDADKVWSIFNEYDVACSFAIPSNTLNNNPTMDGTGVAGLKLRAVVDEMLLDPKNELLGHGKYHSGITSALTEEEVAVECRDAQMQYMNLGYNKVRGSMVAGAPDKYGTYTVSNYDMAGYGYMYRRYFDYGDNLAYNPAYQNPRSYFNATIANLQTQVDNAVTNKTWLRYFAHTLDGSETYINEAQLRAFIEYVISKGINQIEFVSYRHMYETFGTTSFENRIAALETI